VYENLVFGLRMRKTPKAEQRRRVEEIARILGLEEMLQRRPAQLSGGQRQRVAMGRAIVREPKAFLMDEPLSNLDAKLRVQMRAEIARIQQTLRVTTLYVTHDQVEAMTMGHRVAVMRSGVLQQVDTPQRLYDLPGNLFVASFVGSPAMNLLDVALERDGGGLVCRSGDVELDVPGDILARRPQLEQYVGRRIALGIRPEALSESSADPDAPRMRGRALLVEALGAESLAYVEIDARPLNRPELVDVTATQTHLLPVEDHTATILARLEHDTSVKPEHIVDLAVDVRRLHFFDLESGDAIPVASTPVTTAAVV
jgi:multiple sugar transport system ATP-binding protein